MYPDLGPLPNVGWFAMFATVIGVTVGGWAGWWIERRIRTRKWRKLGFTANDLSSKEKFLKKWGEVSIAKMPAKITLTELQSHTWSDPLKYEDAKAAFRALGFRQTNVFRASPQNWVVEFWLTSEPGLTGKIIDSSDRGVYSEVSMTNGDGSRFSFENTEDCGLTHREPDRWVHCGLISPAELVQKALHERHSENVQQMNLAESVSAYEQAVNEYLDWRRSVGLSAEEVNKSFERRKKRQARA